MNAFDGEDLTAAMRGFTLGYVRPAGGLDSLAHRMRVLNQLNSMKGFYKQGGKVQSYASGQPLVYNPLGILNQNQSEESPYRTLTYKPFVEIQPTGDSMFDFIYEGFQPTFPVEPVNSPVAQYTNENKGQSKIEIDTSGPTVEYNSPTTAEDAIDGAIENAIVEAVENSVEEMPEVTQQPVVDVTPQSPQKPLKVQLPPKKPIQPQIPTVTAPADATNVITSQIPKGKIEYARPNIQVGNMQELINLMVEEGISFRITSGYRPGAKTKQGKPSHHGAGNAIDITPIKGQT